MKLKKEAIYKLPAVQLILTIAVLADLGYIKEHGAIYTIAATIPLIILLIRERIYYKK